MIEHGAHDHDLVRPDLVSEGGEPVPQRNGLATNSRARLARRSASSSGVQAWASAASGLTTAQPRRAPGGHAHSRCWPPAARPRPASRRRPPPRSGWRAVGRARPTARSSPDSGRWPWPHPGSRNGGRMRNPAPTRPASSALWSREPRARSGAPGHPPASPGSTGTDARPETRPPATPGAPGIAPGNRRPPAPPAAGAVPGTCAGPFRVLARCRDRSALDGALQDLEPLRHHQGCVIR